jgi:spermidine/putrescine transport system substrate-binding protein
MDKIKPLMETNEFHDKIREGKLTRRQAHKVMASAGIGTAAMASMPNMAGADGHGDDIVMLTWGGYDDPEFAVQYRDEYGGPPEYSLFADQAEALAKMRAGFHADVAFPCISKVKTWVDAGVVEPVDTSMLSHWPDVIDSLKAMPTTVSPDGSPYFIPEDWGTTSVLFRGDLAPEYVDPENHTWGILWDEKYAGRLGALEAIEDHFNVAAIYMGIDFLDMTPEEIEAVGDKVRQQMPLLRMVTGDTTSLTQAIFSGELIASSAWNGMMLTASEEMASEGTEGKYVWMNPKEGALTWVCGLTIHPATKELGTWEQAHALIDAYIEPESQHYELMNWGYGVVNKKAYEFSNVTEEYLNSLGLGLPIDKFLASGKFSAHQEHYGELVNLYDQILAGM